MRTMTIDELVEKYPQDIPVEEAAKVLGKTSMYIRIGLRNNRLPFGTAVLCEGGRWSYSIPTTLFTAYLKGDWITKLYA